jgi:hypothetical protein
MLYKNIVKTDKPAIGYYLVNTKTRQTIVSGCKNALVVKNKVKDFGYYKGYTPH